MSFAFVGNASASGAGVTSLDCNRPAGIAVGELVLVVYAFEGVAAGSGPWIVPNIGQLTSDFIGPDAGWEQACWAGPAAAGVGIEVWWAIHETGTHESAQFVAAQNVVAVAAAWSGEYNPTGRINDSTLRIATTAQVSGNAPAAPSVSVNSGELVIAVGGDLMGGGGFGSPSGFTSRVDVARGGAGTVEATIADVTAPFAGSTGPITFPNAAASGTTKGATATLAIVPAPVSATGGGVVDAPLPEDLQVGNGYAIRVTAIDPVTGALVPGVTVGTTVLTAESEDVGGDISGSDLGTWQLVPGPNA